MRGLAPTSDAPMRRNVMLLAAAQALFQTASVLVMTVGALAGQTLTARPALATTPIAAMFLGTAAATFPASALMSRLGRRPGFLLGAALGVLGGLVAALGIWLRSLPLLCVGTLLVGAYQGFAQFYRFAASEVADEAFRSRAISLVLGGGIVAAFLGPALARFGTPLLPAQYAGSFVFLAVVSVIAAVTLFGLQMPDVREDRSEVGEGRPWGVMVRQPAYLVALFGAATGYGIMILAMTATPIAMLHHQHGIAAAASVIQLHTLGMFLPSFFTGSLIARVGALRIMFAGILLLGAHVVATWTGTSFTSFAAALTLLGIGWNFLYVGGTILLTTTYTPAEKSRAQATNDLTSFAVGLTCSFGSSALLDVFGWRALNALLVPWLVAAGLALIWLGARSRRAATVLAPHDDGIPRLSAPSGLIPGGSHRHHPKSS